MKRALATGFLTTLAALAACGAPPYYGTASITDQQGDPNAIVNPNLQIELAEGSAASAHIELDALVGGEMDGDIRSRNPGILQIFHTPGDGKTYLFLGVKAGIAEVDLYTDGVAVRSINAVVTPPPFALNALDAGADGGSDAGITSDAEVDAPIDANSASDASDAAVEAAVDASALDAGGSDASLDGSDLDASDGD